MPDYCGIPIRVDPDLRKDAVLATDREGNALGAIIGGRVQGRLMAQMLQEERAVKKLLREWLPRPLRWLADHPRLLKLYVRLPHRTEIVGEQRGTVRTYTIKRRGRR